MQQRLQDSRFAATILVPLFNHEEFLVERLQSLLSQWRSDYELLLIDDASTDGGFKLALQILSEYSNIETVVKRNPTRRRMASLQDVLELSRSDIIIQADSDDTALPGRLSRIVDCFNRDSQCRLVTSNGLLLSKDSNVIGLLNTRDADCIETDAIVAATKSWDPRWLGATAAFHRSIFDLFPPLDPTLCPYGLDNVMALRALFLGSHHYLAEPLIGRRLHERNRNTVNGAGSSDIADHEHKQALKMMVEKQRLSDTEFIYKQRGKEVENVLKECRRHFRVAFERWCRLRTELNASRVEPTSTSNRRFAGQPPVVSLSVGTRVNFGTSFGAAVLTAWTGFHSPEPEGIWTERQALIGFRASKDVSRIHIALEASESSNREPNEICLQLFSDNDTTECIIEKKQEIYELPIIGKNSFSMLITATSPSLSSDSKIMYGAKLMWIEAS